MGFVIEKFLELLRRDYHIDFSYTTNNYSYTICLKNIDPKLRKILLSLTFDKFLGFKPTTTSRGEFIGYDATTEKACCVDESVDDNGNPCILISLDENDYGKKLIKIDVAIKTFIQNNLVTG